MTGWRMELTVLTDLSASIFAACFMILLIYLGLAQRHPAAPRPAPAAIEARQAFATVSRHPPRSAEMVELLRLHGAATAGVALDLFADRVEQRDPGEAEATTVEPAALASSLRARGGGPVRLYVFSAARYDAVVEALGGSGAEVAEMSVPRWLRDPERPDAAWSPGFGDLDARALDAPAFRTALADLLAASAEAPGRNGRPQAAGGGPAAGAGSGTAAPSGEPAPRSLLARLGDALAAGATLAGFLLAAAIRRHRPRRGRAMPQSHP